MSTQTHVSRNKHLNKTPSNTYSIIEPPKNTGKPFKRTPAPETLVWINTKEDFELFYERFTAFIGQQNCLQYILEEKFHAIYLQFGQNKYLTLGLANAAKIHPTVRYISEEHLENDVSFLYNALKFCIRGQGVDLIIRQNEY